jgi:hypothetical protein
MNENPVSGTFMLVCMQTGAEINTRTRYTQDDLARAKIDQTAPTILLLSPNTPVQVFRRPIEGDRHRKSITRAN